MHKDRGAYKEERKEVEGEGKIESIWEVMLIESNRLIWLLWGVNEFSYSSSSTQTKTQMQNPMAEL